MDEQAALRRFGRRLVPFPLFAIALGGLAVGFHDALLGVVLSERLTGLLIFLPALAMLVGCALFPTWWPPRRSEAPIVRSLAWHQRRRWATLLISFGSAVGVVLLAEQFLGSQLSGPRITVWSLVAACPLAFCVWQWRSGTTLPGTTKLATAVSLVAVVVGVVQAVYTTANAADADPDTLTLRTQVAVVATVTKGSERLNEIRSSYQIINPGGNRLLFLGSAWSLAGANPTFAATPASASASAAPGRPRGVESATSTRYARYSTSTEQTIELGDKLVGRGHWIAGGGEDDGQIVSYAPVGRYRYLVFTIVVTTVRSDRVVLGAPSDIETDVRHGVRYQDYMIDQPTWVGLLTQSPRFIEVHYLLDPDEQLDGSSLDVVADRTNVRHQGQASFVDQLATTYGIVTDTTSSVGVVGPAQ